MVTLPIQERAADMSWLMYLYRAIVPPLSAALPLASPFSPKLKAALAGRRGLANRLVTAARHLQGCIWIHATSVGEYEQARPVINGLKDRYGDATPPIAVTHFSPSGYEYALKRPCADFHDYLPWDRLAHMRNLVRLWNPRLLIFIKFDFWPNQILAAHDAGVPLLLLAGSLQPRSFRLRAVAKPFWRNLFDRFTHLGVCTEEDQRRFRKDLKDHCPITVTGDTRAEQVILRFEASAGGPVATRLLALGGSRLILGSTWPPDEQLWLPILPDLLNRFHDLFCFLAPHEPRPERLTSLERQLAHRKIGVIRLSDFLNTAMQTSREIRCILVDSVGILAEIYRAGTLAYVGGSFTTGVHNTMEPAVASQPVLFGPVIQNAEEAGVLVQRGAGFVVETPPQALALASELLADSHRLTTLGQIARQVVMSQKGATEKSLALLEPYL